MKKISIILFILSLFISCSKQEKNMHDINIKLKGETLDVTMYEREVVEAIPLTIHLRNGEDYIYIEQVNDITFKLRILRLDGLILRELNQDILNGFVVNTDIHINGSMTSQNNSEIIFHELNY